MDQGHVRRHRVLLNGLGELVQSEEKDGSGHHQNSAQGGKVDRNRNVSLGILPAAEKGTRADDARKVQQEGTKEKVEEDHVDDFWSWYPNLERVSRDGLDRN